MKKVTLAGLLVAIATLPAFANAVQVEEKGISIGGLICIITFTCTQVPDFDPAEEGKK